MNIYKFLIVPTESLTFSFKHTSHLYIVIIEFFSHKTLLAIVQKISVHIVKFY